MLFIFWVVVGGGEHMVLSLFWVVVGLLWVVLGGAWFILGGGGFVLDSGGRWWVVVDDDGTWCMVARFMKTSYPLRVGTQSSKRCR